MVSNVLGGKTFVYAFFSVLAEQFPRRRRPYLPPPTPPPPVRIGNTLPGFQPVAGRVTHVGGAGGGSVLWDALFLSRKQ